MKILIWILAGGITWVFLYFFLIPYIKEVWALWKLERAVKRMAKKYDGELKEQLTDLADGIKDLRENTEMGDYLKED